MCIILSVIKNNAENIPRDSVPTYSLVTDLKLTVKRLSDTQKIKSSFSLDLNTNYFVRTPDC